MLRPGVGNGTKIESHQPLGGIRCLRIDDITVEIEVHATYDVIERRGIYPCPAVAFVRGEVDKIPCMTDNVIRSEWISVNEDTEARCLLGDGAIDETPRGTPVRRSPPHPLVVPGSAGTVHQVDIRPIDMDVDTVGEVT